MQTPPGGGREVMVEQPGSSPSPSAAPGGQPGTEGVGIPAPSFAFGSCSNRETSRSSGSFPAAGEAPYPQSHPPLPRQRSTSGGGERASASGFPSPFARSGSGSSGAFAPASTASRRHGRLRASRSLSLTHFKRLWEAGMSCINRDGKGKRARART